MENSTGKTKKHTVINFNYETDFILSADDGRAINISPLIKYVYHFAANDICSNIQNAIDFFIGRVPEEAIDPEKFVEHYNTLINVRDAFKEGEAIYVRQPQR